MKNKENVVTFDDIKEPITYAFQPIIDLHNNDEIYGYEALLRLEKSSTSEFIDRCIQFGLIHDVEKLTFFDGIKAFEEKGYKGKLFLNSFPNDTLTEKEFLELESRFPKEVLNKVVIELLEYPFFTLNSWNKKEIFFKKNDIELALDDFGTRNNNVGMLDLLSPKICKIDKSIIRNIDKDITNQRIFKSFKKVLDSRGIDILAEGIETQAELDYMKAQGVRFAQGYHIGIPTI